MDYIVVMLCKSNGINSTNSYCLLKTPMDSFTFNTYLDSLALQGHDLKNVCTWSPESKKLRFYEPLDEYGFVSAELISQDQQYLEDINQPIPYWKGLFNIVDTVVPF